MYKTSTQRASWIFTPEQLASIREANHARSVEVVKKLREEQRSAEAAAQQGAGPPADGKKPGKLKFITPADECKLLRYYAAKAQDICRAFGFPAKVAAAALLLLKRAYLAWSCLDHDPKDAMLACIYLAGKVEESYIGAEEFCRVLKQPEAGLLRTEPLLLQALRFELITYPPHRSLQGLLLELEAFLPDAPKEQLKQAGAKAVGAADVLLLTDAPLLFHPGQLAAAALRSGMKSAGLESGGFLEHLAQKAGGGSAAHLAEALRQIDALGVEGAAAVDEAEVKKIDRRLKQCRNPLNDPGSREFQEAAATRQKAEDRARLEKAAKERAKLGGVRGGSAAQAAAKQARVAASQAALLGPEPSAKKQRTEPD